MQIIFKKYSNLKMQRDALLPPDLFLTSCCPEKAACTHPGVFYIE